MNYIMYIEVFPTYNYWLIWRLCNVSWWGTGIICIFKIAIALEKLFSKLCVIFTMTPWRIQSSINILLNNWHFPSGIIWLCGQCTYWSVKIFLRDSTIIFFNSLQLHIYLICHTIVHNAGILNCLSSWWNGIFAALRRIFKNLGRMGKRMFV